MSCGYYNLDYLRETEESLIKYGSYAGFKVTLLVRSISEFRKESAPKKIHDYGKVLVYPVEIPLLGYMDTEGDVAISGNWQSQEESTEKCGKEILDSFYQSELEKSSKLVRDFYTAVESYTEEDEQ